jgi:triosephosphate isomerase
MKKMVVGNLKMNLISVAERDRYLASFNQEMKGKKFGTAEIILCPPFVHLESFSKNIKNKAVHFGGQNFFMMERGSFTGEISPLMLKTFGGGYAILGHSERRRYFGEDDLVINAKLKLALKLGIVPIICIGEKKEEREGGVMKAVVTSQIEGALQGVSGSKLEQIVLAYEPVWAVGTDIFPTSNEVLEARILIRKILTERFGAKRAAGVRILYGGSVNSKMVIQTCVVPEMDGALVGRESLVPREFLKIAEIIGTTLSR